jgi:hypothetical protein
VSETHEEFFKKLNQAAIDEPNWESDLLRQRKSQSFKDGLRDGNICNADHERAVTDLDYAAGVEEGFGQYLVDIPVL